jgi:hypothetical protein
MFLGDDTVVVRWLTDVAENGAITISKAKASDHCLVASLHFSEVESRVLRNVRNRPITTLCHGLEMGAILDKTAVLYNLYAYGE